MPDDLPDIESAFDLVSQGWSRLGADDDAVFVAAGWLEANHGTCQQPIVPFLRKTFGLSAKEAIDAIRMANKGGAHASDS
jgi:hypothetical protein